MNCKMFAVCVVLTLMGCVSVLESATLTLTETTSVNRFMGEVARCARVPALSLAMVKEGQIVYRHGFGTANKQKKEAASSKSVFCLGDITQSFTATLLAKLLNEHQNFTWDTPVREILGTWANFGDRYRNQYLSLRDIFAMRTGLSNMDSVVSMKAMDRFRLISKLRFVPKVASFREKYIHNDLLFVLAEEVVRSLGSDTWYKQVREHVLYPLGMTDTFFINTDVKDQDNFAQPVLSYHGQPMRIPLESMKGQEIIAAGSAICSTADDMAKWIQFNLNEGRTQDGGQLLVPELLEELFEAQTTRSGEGDAMVEGFSQPDIQVSYTREANTLGWIRGTYRGYPVLSQDGSLPGYESLVSFIPSRDVGVFTAFAGDNGPKAYAAKTLVNIYALDLLIHGQPWFSINNFCQVLDNMVNVATNKDTNMARGINPANKAKRALEDYQGFYRNLAFGDVRVKVNGSLFLEFGEMGKYKLGPTNKADVFFMEAMPGPMWYSTHVDILKRKPFVAYFMTGGDKDYIEMVKIPHFDTETNPVFSKHVEHPGPYVEDDDCSGGSSVRVSVAVVVMVIATILR